MIPKVDRHDGRLVVLVDDQRQPVGQNKLLVQDVNLDILNGCSDAG